MAGVFAHTAGTWANRQQSASPDGYEQCLALQACLCVSAGAADIAGAGGAREGLHQEPPKS